MATFTNFDNEKPPFGCGGVMGKKLLMPLMGWHPSQMKRGLNQRPNQKLTKTQQKIIIKQMCWRSPKGTQRKLYTQKL
jgi:hypothetical protein